MKYTIEGFDQEQMINMGLKSFDAIILRWFVDFYATDKMTVVKDDNGSEFKWVKYEAVIEDLPILGIKNKQVIARHFNKMVEAGILNVYLHKKKGTFTCYQLTKKYSVLVEKADHLTQKSNRVDSKVEPGVDSKVEPKDPSIKINPSTKKILKDPQLVKKAETSLPVKKTKDLEPAGSSAFSEIDKIFQAGSEALTGQPYYKDGKESKHIKSLEPRYLKDPDAFINLTRKYYWMITKLEDDFWNQQAFTPSAFNSHYNRILCFQAPVKMQKQEAQKHRTAEDVIWDNYGGYDSDKLKYLLRGGTISQADFDYILKRQTEVSA